MASPLGRQRAGPGETVVCPPVNGVGPSRRRHPLQMSPTPAVERQRRDTLVLWRRPLATIHLAALEVRLRAAAGVRRLWRSRLAALAVLLVTAVALLVYRSEGGHQQWLRSCEHTLLWWLYWLGLGVLSSVGLGTGLHTFLLYLGPHIAAVTMAAYECQSVDFPEPPYPDRIVCPEGNSTSSSTDAAGLITIWHVMSKVRVEAFMWGAGTALGELPPYFMARAARLTGVDADDEDLEEFEDLQRRALEDRQHLSLLDRAKLAVERLVQRVGFLGILACASIPNPLFDLAGITCGHFLVPFWTFFGATLIGKAIIKMHIQKVFVIVTFNERLVETAMQWITLLPLGNRLQQPFQELLAKQKQRLHADNLQTASDVPESLLSAVFEKLVLVMVAYFVVSIVNSLAQSYHKRIYSGKVSGKVARD